ncbi:MAG: succinate dehydrogenase/fumarate reductase iron-sulfur subunit [Candidatus Thermoplasmatota archaeon]|nr:succinate dehydrogenase/fumarate reductase iron-sulfur subunit [Candidatus Thermoplasmatota archaeon]MCL5731562.1 succinate dehydrogenase/fumarate reductase iron-sulfur subunit [Candidatus Thermoplasmatota archaeon]
MKEVTIRIRRSEPSVSSDVHYDEFKVPVGEGMVVLDAVHYIQQNMDQTLAVRWNCKAARCGSCSAEINGRPKLMCKTRIDSVGDKITINPIKAYPVVKDLVTDVSHNYEIAKKIPPFTPKEGLSAPFKMFQIDVTRSKEFRTCIECFLCQDVCHVIREHHSNYFGPKHMVKVAALDMHPIDAIDRSELLHGEGGVGYCDITKCCQNVCPEDIRITDNAIIPEKERIVDHAYDPIGILIKKVKNRRW